MTSLKTLQNLFQKNILNHYSDIEKFIPSTKNLSASQQIQIYQNSYYERIILAMSQDFPIIKTFLGEDAFAGMVCDYVKKYPSTNFNLRYVGKNLAKFLLETDATLAPFAELAEQEFRQLTTSNINNDHKNRVADD